MEPLVALGSVTGFWSPPLLLRGCERSIRVGPESICWSSVASTAASFGLVVPKAQMMVCAASPFDCEKRKPVSVWRDNGRVCDDRLTGIVNVILGVDPVRSLALGSADATRGGFESTVGITSPGAVRCESVILPSELGHIMTMGVFAMVDPKPLQMNGVSEGYTLI